MPKERLAAKAGIHFRAKNGCSTTASGVATKGFVQKVVMQAVCAGAYLG